jgi:hypothetical protein
VDIPLVIHCSPRVDGVPFVGIDNRAAAEAGAEHLLARGHRSLVVISQPFGPSRRARHRDPAKLGRPSYRVTRERLAGYQAAADAATPHPAALHIYEIAVNNRDEGHRAALALLHAGPRPTAVLAMSDQLALGALAAARELNLGVPTSSQSSGGTTRRALVPAIPPSPQFVNPCTTKDAPARSCYSVPLAKRSPATTPCTSRPGSSSSATAPDRRRTRAVRTDWNSVEEPRGRWRS